MQYHLRTLLILLAVGPVVFAGILSLRYLGWASATRDAFLLDPAVDDYDGLSLEEWEQKKLAAQKTSPDKN